MVWCILQEDFTLFVIASDTLCKNFSLSVPKKVSKKNKHLVDVIWQVEVTPKN